MRRPPFHPFHTRERPAPPEGDAEESSLHYESDYLRRLVDEQTAVAVRLRTGETVHGFIEFYDRRFIRLTRQKQPNLFIFKQDIRYLYEE